MITISHKGKKRKNLIIFVHGLTGGEDTWINTEGKSFADMLFLNKDIKKKFDIADFSYYSRIFTSKVLKQVKSGIASFFGIDKAVRINLDIEEIANLLLTEFEIRCDEYESVILIGHSLGGLISKAAMLSAIQKGKRFPVKLFISLAVPHGGSKLADWGCLVNSSAQIANLVPLNDKLTKLSTDWLQTPDEKLPKRVYFHGAYDTVVPSTSAIAFEKSQAHVLEFPVNHTQICKPTDADSSIYLAVVKQLIAFIEQVDVEQEMAVKVIKDKEVYNSEIFVLKMLVAEVHHKNISSAKQNFYNAEFIRKIIVARKVITQAEFEKLYALIEGIYNNAFGLLTSGTINGGNALVAYVHKNIQDEDQKILKSVSNLTFIHKSGMLHQLANSLESDIWWNDGHNEETIREFQEKNPSE